jgi:hypothetical protein
MEVLLSLMPALVARPCGVVHVHQEANTVLQEKNSALELSNRRLLDELKGEVKMADGHARARDQTAQAHQCIRVCLRAFTQGSCK